MKKSLWINRVTAMLTILAMLFLCGCRGGNGRNESPDTTAAPSASPLDTSAPEQGGTLRLPMPVNASTEDPLSVDTEEMLLLFSLVYDKLFTVNSAGELEPCLCESWSGEGDGVWMLKLREGVKWHDGGGLTSEDVTATFASLKELGRGYYKTCLDRIVDIEAVDRLTVRASLSMPGIIGLYSLIVPIKSSGGGELIGTGAYRLERRDDDSITLRVNADWWDKQPYIERVVFSERDSNSTALASYDAGQLNMVPTDLLTAGKYAESGVTNVQDIMTQNMEVLLFNHESSVFSERFLRLAVAHAVNRSKIVTNIYMNRARVSDVPFPPDSWLSDSRSEAIGYDASAALSLVEDAGFTVMSKEGIRYSKAGENLAIKLLTSASAENTVRSDAAKQIAASLTELGFYVEIITAQHTLASGESDFVKKLREGEWDIALVGFNLGLGNDLTSYISSDGANNFGHINDPELEALSRAMLVADSEQALREASYAFQSYFIDNLPFVVLYFRLNSIVCSARIMGMEGTREPYTFENVKNWYFRN